MKYYSHYIWESGNEEKRNPVSVVLQQVSLNKHRYLLVCVCDGARSSDERSLVSGYFTERLVEWFHHRYILLLQNHREESVQRELTAELSRIEAELQEYGRQKEIIAEYDVWGMFICDNQFWSFVKGACKGYLFNRRFNKKQRTCLQKLLFSKSGSQLHLVQGSLQKDVGILICNPAFDTNISEEEMLSVLFEERLSDRDIQKRLRELWNENKRRGENGYAGAVFFRTE